MSSLLVMEISLGIVGGSLPTIKPLFVQCFPQLLRSNITSHPRNTGDMYALENGYQRGTFRAKTQGTKTHDTFNDSEEAIVLEDIKVGDLMLDADQQSGEGGKSDHWGGIQKTTCVKVDYGSREKGLSMV